MGGAAGTELVGVVTGEHQGRRGAGAWSGKSEQPSNLVSLDCMSATHYTISTPATPPHPTHLFSALHQVCHDLPCADGKVVGQRPKHGSWDDQEATHCVGAHRL